jgi:hypothetical protein
MILFHGSAVHAPTAARKPPVCVSTWRIVMTPLPLAPNAGMYFATGSSSAILPRSHTWARATTVIGLVADIQSMMVSGVITTPSRAMPNARSATGLKSSET